MSDERDARPASGPESPDWPVAFRGITESVVTTLGPNDLWNVAALGLHPPESTDSPDESGGSGDGSSGGSVTARTWGNTRTRRNFHRQGGGYVQFTHDPVDFADAALSIREVEEPVLASADAWAEVSVERVEAGESGGTEWEEWELVPGETGVERETVPTVSRGFNAVVEATVAASRLGVDAYDQSTLRDRLAYFEEVATSCGGRGVERAFDRIRSHVEE